MGPQPPSNEALIEEFLNYLREKRHFSPHTVTGYAADLHQFCEYLTEGDGAPNSLTAVTATTVKEFMDFLAQRGYAASTIVRKTATLRSFYKKFCLPRAYVPLNPLELITTPRLKKQPPVCLNESEISKLLEAPDTRELLGCRDRAIFETMCCSGVRVSELIDLNRADVRLEDEMLHIQGRGKKHRLAPLSPAALAWIKCYEERRDQEPCAATFNQEALFLNKHGQRLSTRSVRRKLEKCLARARLPRAISPQTLRDSFANNLVQKGKGYPEVQLLLGHQSLSTTTTRYHRTKPITV